MHAGLQGSWSNAKNDREDRHARGAYLGSRPESRPHTPLGGLGRPRRCRRPDPPRLHLAAHFRARALIKATRGDPRRAASKVSRRDLLPMTTISKNATPVTFINLFTVDPANPVALNFMTAMVHSRRTVDRDAPGPSVRAGRIRTSGRRARASHRCSGGAYRTSAIQSPSLSGGVIRPIAGVRSACVPCRSRGGTHFGSSRP